MITAKGEVVDISEHTQPDLLYAIRGAGQYFGLITRLTIKAHPMTVLGNEEGKIWSGVFIFPLDRAQEVAQVMKPLMEDSSCRTAGLIFVMAPPPQRSPSVMVAARYLGSSADADAAYKPLHDLKPLMAMGKETLIQNANDGREAMDAKGGLKRFTTVALKQFDADGFMKTVDVWKRLVAACPDAINSMWMFLWDSRLPKDPGFESANCLHDIRYYQ